jgi:Holliday junction resolvasome RuvABC endonuclease subunit
MTEKRKPIVVRGYDVSLNHGACVQLRDGKLDRYWYFTTSAGCAKRSPYGERLKLAKDDDPQRKGIARLAWIRTWVAGTCDDSGAIGIEDYAVGKARRAHYMGEVGGTARLVFWDLGAPFRLHDPTSVKMFVTHNGAASKDEVEGAVRDRWGADFSKYNAPAPKGRVQSRQTSEDLADAFSVAMLVHTESCLRAGRLQLDDLAHDKERQVFLRVTKSYPVNLLGREWIWAWKETERP